MGSVALYARHAQGQRDRRQIFSAAQSLLALAQAARFVPILSQAMTAAEFKKLPPLVWPRQLRSAGFTRKVLLALRHSIAESGSDVPIGKIGYLRISKTFGKYRRSDAARLLGPEWL